MSTDTVNTARKVFNPFPDVEDWRWIPGYEDHYAVSSLGRIRSHKVHPEGRIVKLTPGGRSGKYHPDAGLTWTPFMGGNRRGMTVARAVALAFIGPPPEEGMVARHLSKRIQDNRPVNIEWSF